MLLAMKADTNAMFGQNLTPLRKKSMCTTAVQHLVCVLQFCLHFSVLTLDAQQHGSLVFWGLPKALSAPVSVAV